MTDNNRDSKTGQFVKGNKAGRGRPRREIEEDYLKAISEEISKADWRAIIRKAAAQAKKGCPKARVWLSDYLVGKATAYVQADVSTGFSEGAFMELLALMDPLIADEHREAYEESLKALSEKMEER